MGLARLSGGAHVCDDCEKPVDYLIVDYYYAIAATASNGDSF
jgi:hypothetical protein